MDPEQQKIIEKIAGAVEQKLAGEGSGHDWWHIVRVWNMAKHIAKCEGANFFVVELAALLHDIADWKFHAGDDTVGPKMAREILKKHPAPAETIDHVCDLIAGMSSRGDARRRRQDDIAWGWQPGGEIGPSDRGDRGDR